MLAILATSILALNPSTITNAQAMPYGSEDYYDDRYSYGDQYGYDTNYYYQDDNRYSYDKKDLKSYGDIQKISCVNSNINVNGIDITQIPEDNTATAAAANEGGADAASAQNENGFDKINFNRNLVNICVNVNVNDQVKVDTSPQLPETCEGCFSVLSDQEKTTVIFYANQVFQVETIHSILDLCDFLQTSTLPKTTLGSDMAQILDNAAISIQDKDFILGCLENLGLILGPT